LKIAEYYASLGFRVDRREIRKVDNYLKTLENKLRRFNKNILGKNLNIRLNIDKFNVNQKRMNTVLGNALDRASSNLVFQINRFNVDQRAMRAALIRAGRVAGQRGLPVTSRVTQQVIQRQQAPAAQGAASTNASASRSRGSYGRANYLHAGGAAGAFMRYGAASLPFIGGIYGMGALNRGNQEQISNRLTTQAVIQGRGGTEGQGKEAFAWLRNLANDVGFNYTDAAPEYNQFLANALGAGLDTEGAQGIFQGFSEYQTAMGVTPARRKLVQNALSQMLGKGVLSMEEVRRQMSESMPG
jgi:hypothetical protein